MTKIEKAYRKEQAAKLAAAEAALFELTQGYDVGKLNAHVASVAEAHDVDVYALSNAWMDSMERAETESSV